MRAPAVAAAVALAVATVSTASPRGGDAARDFSATPGAPCRPADRVEEIQGRVPLADYRSGRAFRGYNCNADEISQTGSQEGGTGASGGYRVHRYTDAAGRTCAYYDTTLLFPANARAGGTRGTGVWVLDMTDPSDPVHTATLSTAAMQSPHESLDLNARRGLLGAVFANPAFHAGQFDLYDVSTDCRHPSLRSSLPVGILGHEGSFAPDGKTYYATSLYGHTITAIDTSDPAAPTVLWASARWNVHGLNVSDDGTVLYFADLGRGRGDALGEPAGTETKGLTILDVGEIQARTPMPEAHVLSHLTWPHVSTPQTVLPFTVGGRHYVVEVDEFGEGDNVGAARIVDVEDPRAPRVVSNIRLAVHNASHQNATGPGAQQNDPGASNSLGGYTGHYCALPSRNDPRVVACSFILSGLRVFDISDPSRPVEIAYYNEPSTDDHASLTGYGAQGAYAMSQPAFDAERKHIWYSDGNSGFRVVRIDPDAWPAEARERRAAARPGESAVLGGRAGRGPLLPATGASDLGGAATVALCSLAASSALASRLRRRGRFCG